ncbi:hypothetical protein H310_11967 [Aphanomyces invadans]|uniref:Phosphatidate cytidylyltransferase n=1 Tax=Aphanomyces invadans TaxID=157072 RepID=A0A024TJU6_9STRA|nr:hypothetical protein H310_11967 [Aphanomyces invadans]ETV94318.1 hypothetical protein H310_11967 [Aphanomyces invadans]|eukprot:XP_008877080.1 hypothetical protein H310_11967 [Aphanomyces invadans]
MDIPAPPSGTGESLCRNFVKRLVAGVVLATAVVLVFVLCPRATTSALMATLLALCMYEYSWLVVHIKALMLAPSPVPSSLGQPANLPPLSSRPHAHTAAPLAWIHAPRLVVVALVSIAVVVATAAFFLGLFYVDTIDVTPTLFYYTFLPYVAVSAAVTTSGAFFSPNVPAAVSIVVSQISFLIIIMDSLLCPYDDVHCSYVIDTGFVLTAQSFVMCAVHLMAADDTPSAYLSMLLDQLGVVYIVGLIQILSNFVDLSAVSVGRKNVLVLLFTVWAADSGSYFTGHLLRNIGYKRFHPLARHLSPNKDIEGTVGGVVFGLVAMFIATNILHMTATGIIAKVAVTTAAILFSRCGDLFESLIKRAADVKDSSHLIPGHGGFLDRVDALLFASILFALYNIHLQLLE